MKITKERLRELIKEEMADLEQEARRGRNRQDVDDPGEFRRTTPLPGAHSSFISKLKSVIEIVTDSFQKNRDNPGYKFPEEKMIQSGLNIIKDAIKENPEFLLSIAEDMNEALKQTEESIQRRYPSSLDDFKKVSKEFLKFATELQEPISSNINENKIKIKLQKK